MSLDAIDPHEFAAAVCPLLQRKDVQGLWTLLKSRWKPEQIRQLVHSEQTDAKKLALLALALVGLSCCAEDLAEELKNPDPLINELAEHALWSVWLRGGNVPEAQQLMSQGTEAMNQRDFDAAVGLFNKAIHCDPDFSEAYNQRAIAYYLQEQYQKSIDDCRRAIRRMPFHFGAWAGMGHCHAQLRQMDQAIECYRKAIEINPHLKSIRESIEELSKPRGGDGA